MLDDKQLYAISRPVLQLAREIEWELIQNIALRLQMNDDIGGTARWQIQKLEMLGGLHEDNLKVLSKYSGKTLEEIKKMMDKAGLLAIDYPSLNEAYKRGLVDVDPRLVEFKPVLETFTEALQSENRLLLTKTITESNTQYQAIIDRVTMETSRGIKSYTQALTDSLRELADKGIYTTTYKGINKHGRPYVSKYPIEASVRRSIMTGINQVSNHMNEKMVDELKPDHIGVSAHLGARDKGVGHENHESWQGQVYRNDGEFELVTGYGDPDMLGLAGYNCRHIHYPFFEGLTPMPEQINTEENRERYALDQRQRLLERRIRESKKRIELMEMTGGDVQREKNLLKSRQKMLRDFVEENNLVRQYERERII